MDDLISRQAAIDALCKWESESTWDSWCEKHKDEPERYNILAPSMVVKELPSAQRTGRWIWSEEEWGYTCSACRVKFDYDKTYELFDHGFMLANYCPNCGARMEGEEE